MWQRYQCQLKDEQTINTGRDAMGFFKKFKKAASKAVADIARPVDTGWETVKQKTNNTVLGSLADGAIGLTSDAGKFWTGGIVDLKNQKVSMDLDNMTKNLGEGMTLSSTRAGLMGAGGAMAQLPEGEDPVAQAARVKAEETAKTAKEYDLSTANMSGTLLGGAVGTDSKTLRKRRLLGG